MNQETKQIDLSSLNFNTEPINPDRLRAAGKLVKENSGASLFDIGDKIGLIEFHTKANALNDDVCEMISFACLGNTDKFDGLVIGNRGKHFSAGADLGMVLESAKAGKWSALEHTVRLLQNANMAIRHGELPVVAAPFSSTLGGGCEVCLHAAIVVAAAETRMGVVETSVGLIPAGGGTKELGIRALDRYTIIDPVTALLEPFKNITTAKVSKSGEEAKQLFLSGRDIVTPSSWSDIGLAKQVVSWLIGSGYRNSSMRTDIRVIGKKGITAFQERIRELFENNTISEHDAIIAGHVANVLCGGDQEEGIADEQHFLDLEREAFLHLLGTEKTRERIEYLLLNNRPLRN